ncbi:MAG: GNAT family N-acetyltransferase [Planctomycetales bacterium]|nr:GNAT family N-acetyltransferase [Planctomycetales bacterium]
MRRLFSVVCNEGPSVATAMQESTLDVSLRPMVVDDYDAVVALWRGTDGLGGVETHEALTRYLARNPGFSQVAVCGERVVGAILCGHDGRRGYIYRLTVAHDVRRRGLGRRLVDACLEKLREECIDHVTLFILKDNAAAAMFWTELGWVERVDLRTFAKYM